VLFPFKYMPRYNCMHVAPRNSLSVLAYLEASRYTLQKEREVDLQEKSRGAHGKQKASSIRWTS
jgi:hypothetical protein